MRHYILFISFFIAIGTQAQQVNPVPDYVFRNQMSVGRNAVTDTAAYISIGPRYGANKGLMPPIVSDTAAITGVKRNGLLIFSVQRNNFQYWDSINSRWTSVTANVDTTIISTRAWRKKGDDSLGAVIATKVNISDTATMLNPYTRGSGTVNRVAKFTGTRTFGNSSIADSAATFRMSILANNIRLGTDASITNVVDVIGKSGDNYLFIRDSTLAGAVGTYANTNVFNIGSTTNHPTAIRTNNAERLRISANGRVGVNTTTDAGYQFDVAGSMRNTTGAAFATSSGGVLISSSSFVDANDKLQIENTVDGPYGIRLINQSTNSAATSRIVFGTQGGNYTIEGLRNGNELRFVRGTTEAMRINSSGLVGIGTTSPSEALHVVGRGRFTTIDSTSSPINVLTSDVNGVIRKTAPGVLGSGTTNYIPKFTASGTIGNSQIFDNGAIVNINSTTTPAGIRFNVNGNSNYVGAVSQNPALSSASYYYMGFADTLRSYWGSRGGFDAGPPRDYIIGVNGNNTFSLYTNGTRRINITGGGNVLVNTSSDAGYQMDIAGTLRSTQGANFATTSGEVLIGTTTDVGDYRLQVNGNANFRDDVLIDTNLRVNRHISLDQTLKAWALGNAIEGPQGSTLFVAGGGVQTLANVYYDGSYKYSTSNPGAAMFLLQSGITFATYGSGTANGALTGANEMVYAGGELRVGIADQGTFKLQVADKSYFGDEVQIASTTDLGNYKLQVTGEAIITAGIRTDAPSGGTAATWKLGTVATVSPTSPNRTIEVEIGGTTYYIHAKTTNN